MITIEDTKSTIMQKTVVHSLDSYTNGKAADDAVEQGLIVKSIEFEYDLSTGGNPIFTVQANFNTIEEAVEAYNAIKDFGEK